MEPTREEQVVNMIKDYHLSWWETGVVIFVVIMVFIAVLFALSVICMNIINLIVK